MVDTCIVPVGMRADDPIMSDCTQHEHENGEPSEQIELVLKVSHERINDLICGAFEGGSNYWYCIGSFNYPDGETKESLGIEFEHMELPMKGGSLTITVEEEDDGKIYTLDKEACIRGLKVMAEKYPEHFADWRNEDDDATTADVYLQCCLFGEIVYS